MLFCKSSTVKVGTIALIWTASCVVATIASCLVVFTRGHESCTSCAGQAHGGKWRWSCFLERLQSRLSRAAASHAEAVCREFAREGANGRNARNNSTHFTFAATAATIKAYVREAIAVEKAGLRMKPKNDQSSAGRSARSMT